MFNFRWYQDEAINSVFQYFSENNGNPVIALPTGTGKSLVIGGFIKRVLGIWPKQRFMVLTHVKELIEQDARKLYEIWNNAPIGIYSAGLKQKDIGLPVIFGGVGSVIKAVEKFGHRDLIIIDECHLLSPKDNTMYQVVISKLKAVNPYLKVIGLSATPYRLGQGMITDDGLFTDICYDKTGIEAFNRFIAEGFLAPLIPKKTDLLLDVSGVGINNGEYSKGELQQAVDKQEITYNALREAIEYGYDRKSWLCFASGVEHSEHIAEMLNSFGISAAAVHSKIPPVLRDQRINAFKAGALRCLVNNNVLTTGFDHPPIDFIIMLRPTISPGLWVQMLGRGTRPCIETGKQNCLVMDFAGNTKRLGPINDPVIPRKKGNKPGDAPVRICENCGVYNHASARFCDFCGFEFEIKTKLMDQASEQALLRSDLPEVEYFNVDRVVYKKHEKDDATPSLKVSYFCGFQMFTEWVCLEHSNFARRKAEEWWRQRHASEPPDSIDEALTIVSELRAPRRIRVWVNKKYPEVLSYEY